MHREKTSQAFRDALYGGIRMNSLVKVRRTIIGATRKKLLQTPIDSIDIKTSDHFGYTKQDVFEYSNDIQKVLYSHNHLIMGNNLGISPRNTVSPSLSSKGSCFTPLKNIVHDCDHNSQKVSTLHETQSINQNHSTVRPYNWKGNDVSSDRGYIISDQPTLDMNSIQTETSYKKQGYIELVAWFEHPNYDESKPSLHHCNDALVNNAKNDEESRIHDYYISQINDILYGRRIQKSIAHYQQQRRCSIDCNGLIQNFEIGDIDPFEPMPY